LFKVNVAADAAAHVKRVLDSGYIGQGQCVDAFEDDLAMYLGHPAPITLNSATSGLTLALRLVCGMGESGEVLTPPITCTATNFPILALGQRIRWVDTDPRDGNMDLNDLRRKISSDTKAIMLVHWGGYPNDLDTVQEIQEECREKFGHRPAVIEDAAHAFGSEYNHLKLGSHGNYCVYSFQAIKHVTCGDGGALLCPQADATDRARLLRWYGIDRTRSDDFRCAADIVEWGYKFHMNDINAAIGRANLPLIEETLRRNRENAAYYRTALQDVPGLTLLQEDPKRKSAYWLFTFRAQNRDGLQQKLQEAGIICGRVHERNDRYTCTQPFRDPDLPGTDIMHREMLCIPVGWWVTNEDRERIVNTIHTGW